MSRPARTTSDRYEDPFGRLRELSDIGQRQVTEAAAARQAGGRPPSAAVRAGHAVRHERDAEAARRAARGFPADQIAENRRPCR